MRGAPVEPLAVSRRRIGPSQRSPTARSMVRAVRGTSGTVAGLLPLPRTRKVLVEAKTLDASAGYESDIATRAFWQARGVRSSRLHRPSPTLAARQSVSDSGRRARPNTLTSSSHPALEGSRDLASGAR
jgi:hypothetical protein